jgi:hypothetical protein
LEENIKKINIDKNKIRKEFHGVILDVYFSTDNKVFVIHRKSRLCILIFELNTIEKESIEYILKNKNESEEKNLLILLLSNIILSINKGEVGYIKEQ